ncbi:hypothetical protein V8B97DRAFT_1041251 [Scleroderma yunnanense]
MAHAKDKHYWAQLRAALTAGNWRADTVAHAPNAIQLGWSKLFYKFNKHCRGFQDVAEIASQTRLLALLLGANTTDEDEMGNEKGDILRVGDGCILAPERVQEASEGYQALMRLDSKHTDSLYLALAHYAYALGRPEECIAHLAKVQALVDAQSHIPTASTTRSDPSSLQVPGTNTGTSSPLTGSFVSAISPPSTTDISDGRAWAITESLRSICLQGMSYEKLSPSDPDKAIQAYKTSIALLDVVQFEIQSALTPQSTPNSFTQYRELWRWTERLIFRAITLLARVSPLDGPHGLIWTFFHHYERCSVYWSPSFRFSHRAIISQLHLRALVLKYGIPSEQVSLNTSLQPQKPPHWLSTARSVAKQYCAILDHNTQFPRAGEKNDKVEDFVDLCVAVWEASGSMSDRAGWVIDILWWATRLTFNSYRIFRHMGRLLYIAGDSELAKKTLRLYVQVVGKAREAGMAGDYDTDRHWVETLVQGSRMLCRLGISRPGLDGMEEVKEAGELIEKAKARLDKDDKELVARVALAEGVWHTISAMIEGDPQGRPTRFALALDQFIKSVRTYPTPAAYHHLALSLALPGPSQDLDEAITSAAAAVEYAPHEIRHWHLLGLLLSAQGQWEKAKGALEFGASIGEGTSESDENGEFSDPPNPEQGQPSSQNGIRTNGTGPNKTIMQDPTASLGGDAGMTEYAPSFDGSSTFSGSLLDPDATAIPQPATLLQPLPDYPAPSPRDAFEYALQLRLTQMALMEHVEGPEGAESKWVNVYRWIAERRGTVSDTPMRSSMDTGSRSAATQTEFIVVVTTSQFIDGKGTDTDLPGSLGLSIATTDESAPPPITVTPATPADADHRFSLSRESQDKVKRTASMGGDPSAGKKMQQMLKERVHKGQEKISTISKKIGHGVVKNGALNLRRANSAPDFHAVLQNHQYQASSIHSRRRLRAFMRYQHAHPPLESPPAPPPPTLPPVQVTKIKTDVSREDKLLSDLWAASAATFRRQGKIEQAKGAIQEAEVKNPDNPAVWVQFGLYHYALNHERQAVDALQKALFISPEDVPATVHMCRIYLDSSTSKQSPDTDIDRDKVDLSAGLLRYITRSRGWDVPEAWYYLAKAYGLQGRKDEECECLVAALRLSERRCIRDVGRAVGWCL